MNFLAYVKLTYFFVILENFVPYKIKRQVI